MSRRHIPDYRDIHIDLCDNRKLHVRRTAKGQRIIGTLAHILHTELFLTTQRVKTNLIQKRRCKVQTTGEGNSLLQSLLAFRGLVLGSFANSRVRPQE